MGKVINITNQRFGRLVAICPIGMNKYHNIIWKCKCDCGNESYVVSSSLRRGLTKSCGCLHKEIAGNDKKKNLIGKQFGMWTVLEELPQRNSNQKILYKCQCKCGNIKNVVGGNLLNGGSMSCGCMNMSHGEFKIKEILIKNNIDFIQEYHPNDFKYFQNARYDFYIPQTNTLIEYDGKQHFMKKHVGWDEDLQEIQKRDNLKNKWAIENNYNLIRIPYTHYDDLCLEDLSLNTSKFLFKINNK